MVELVIDNPIPMTNSELEDVVNQIYEFLLDKVSTAVYERLMAKMIANEFGLNERAVYNFIKLLKDNHNENWRQLIDRYQYKIRF